MSLRDLAKLTCLVLLLLVGPLSSSAQDLDEDFESEFPTEDLPYVGFGGGLTATYIFMNLDELNKLARSFEVDEFGGPLVVYGGGLIITPIFIRNIRLAAHAFGGYHRSSRPILLDSVEYNRTLRFGIRFQGMAGADYAIPMLSRFTVLPGVMAGWGSYALEFTQSHSPRADFFDAWDPGRFSTDTAAVMDNHNRAVRMINYHAFVMPMLQLEYAVTGSLMLRLAGGYRFGLLDEEWNSETETIYDNVPTINANGPTLQFGIYGGLFQQ